MPIPPEPLQRGSHADRVPAPSGWSGEPRCEWVSPGAHPYGHLSSDGTRGPLCDDVAADLPEHSALDPLGPC
jgi:hypothetical protein